MIELFNIFEEEVFSTRSERDLFNQYKDNNPEVDRKNASSIRRNNLKNYLETFHTTPRTILVGEAPGPWGCRFSGVPFTSEYQFTEGDFPFNGTQSSNNSEPYEERASKSFWKATLDYHYEFVVINCVPIHPHIQDQPLTIRTPRAGEVRSFLPITEKILNTIRPELVVSVGKKAEKALDNIGVSSIYVRHPSHGGSSIFRNKIKDLLGSI